MRVPRTFALLAVTSLFGCASGHEEPRTADEATAEEAHEAGQKADDAAEQVDDATDELDGDKVENTTQP